LRQRGSLTVWFTEAAIAAWKAEPRATRGGQPRYSALAIITALTLRAVFRLALRLTEGLIAPLLRLLGLDLAAPDHSTMSRLGETLPVSRPRAGSDPLHLLVDSTGLKLCGPKPQERSRAGLDDRRGQIGKILTHGALRADARPCDSRHRKIRPISPSHAGYRPLALPISQLHRHGRG
jgi:hypothetical protein